MRSNCDQFSDYYNVYLSKWPVCKTTVSLLSFALNIHQFCLPRGFTILHLSYIKQPRLSYWYQYQHSITIAANNCISAHPLPLIDHHLSFISVTSALLLKIYKTRHMTLTYPSCHTHLSEVQIPKLPMDITTCAKLIQERIAIMGAKNLPYSSAHNMSLFNHVCQFRDSLWQLYCFPTLKNPATHRISLHYFTNWLI